VSSFFIVTTDDEGPTVCEDFLSALSMFVRAIDEGGESAEIKWSA